MFLVAANAAGPHPRRFNAVGEEKGGTTGEESRGCDDEEGKFQAALSGKGWLTHTRGTKKWKEIMGQHGDTMTCRPAENYDSSFSARVSFSFSRHF